MAAPQLRDSFAHAEVLQAHRAAFVELNTVFFQQVVSETFCLPSGKLLVLVRVQPRFNINFYIRESLYQVNFFVNFLFYELQVSQYVSVFFFVKVG